MPTQSKYHYTSPHQMQPMLPGEKRMDALRPLAAELIASTHRLVAHGMPQLRALLRETLRPMNSFYTNKIEGQHTTPLMIERAMRADFSDAPDEAKKQRIAIAHIATERWGENAFQSFDAPAFFHPDTVKTIHQHLHAQLADADLIQKNSDGSVEIVQPGQWRASGVKIGQHIPPDPATVPQFMDEWQRSYGKSSAGENALIAVIAAHHRLAWIHPFIDGNGRTARLHSHLALNALGLTHGLWSPMRGLARNHESYYTHLINADRDRQGNYDGRGVLSEQGLVSFIEFFMRICLDQASFMSSILDIAAFEARLTAMLAAEATKPETKALKIEAAAPLAYLGTVASLERTKFKGMMGLAARTADRTLADLFKLGIITSKSPKGPVELALPIALFGYLFPRLWPEAEMQM